MRARAAGSVLIVLLVGAPLLAFADVDAGAAPASSAPASKLTLGVYLSSGRVTQDLNLRHQLGDWTAWLGGYRNEDHQLEGRAGLQYNWQPRDFLLQAVAQGGTTGFLQGSLYSEIGGAWFGIAGFSRTNGKPQDDLTFDPNNSIQLGAGFVRGEHDRVATYVIFDDRFHTGQEITHALFKHRMGPHTALTLDAFYKSGHTESGRYVRAAGGGVYLDHAWFAKLYVDPYASFGDTLQVRLFLGRKF